MNEQLLSTRPVALLSISAFSFLADKRRPERVDRLKC